MWSKSGGRGSERVERGRERRKRETKRKTTRCRQSVSNRSITFNCFNLFQDSFDGFFHAFECHKCVSSGLPTFCQILPASQNPGISKNQRGSTWNRLKHQENFKESSRIPQESHENPQESQLKLQKSQKNPKNPMKIHKNLNKTQKIPKESLKS